MKKIIVFAFLFLISASNVIFAQVSWKQTRGPWDGSTNSLTVDSLQHIYVCTGGDGVMQSTDHGVTWHGFNRGLRVLPMKWVESSTGSSDQVAYVYGLSHRKELMRRVFTTVSTDNQWEYLDSIVSGFSTLDVTQMMTNHKGYLYLATANFGVIRTRDNGDHFDQPKNLKAPTPDSFIVCMTVDRRNQDLYAISDSATYRQSDPTKWVVHLSRSTDDGTTWQRLPSVLPNALYISKILIADDGSIILGYHVSIYDTNRVYRSTNLGQSWVPVLQLPISHHQDIDGLIHAVKGSDLYINAHGPTFRSTDNGATWIVQSPEKMGEEPFSLVCDSSNYLYQCAIPDGVFRSTNLGVSWSNMDSTLLVQHLDGGIGINSHGDVFTMSQFNIYRTTNQGDSWYKLPNELDEAQFPLISCDREDYVFYNTYFGLYRSHDNGETFDKAIDWDSTQHKGNQVIYWAVSPKDELWAASQYDVKGDGSEPWFARSVDHGTTWTRVNTSGLYGIPSYLEVNAFGFSAVSDPKIEDTMYVCGNTSDIYRSINDGANWEVISNEGGRGSGIRQFIGHPDGSVIMLDGGTLEDHYPDNIGGVFRSTNGGKDWTKVFPPDSLYIQDYSLVEGMCLDRLGRILVATTDSGFYLSNTTFTEWTNVSSGFWGDDFRHDKPLNASQVIQNPKTGVFFADSRGASVFKSKPDLADFWSAVPHATPLSSSISEPVNYPNPFARSTQISIDMPHSGFAKVSVYDVMGRLIKVMYNGPMEAGKHTLSFDAATMLSNGKYMIVLQSGNDETSHWMTLTK